jgi:protein O-mannosyl-transferase
MPDARGMTEASGWNRRRLAILLAVVAAMVLVTHWPALSAKAISFDDDQYLTQNPLVLNPSWANAGRFLTEVLKPSTVQGYYQPLSMISLMLDSALGGSAENLRPYHRTSLFLHVANTMLVVVLLYLLCRRPWLAALAGLLFGVHPMTVEPIPWIGERKTLLAAFFALWSLIFYIRYARSQRWDAYLLSLGFFLLALMSKPTATALPLAMLLLDFWPLCRLSWRRVLEKAPFLILAAAFAVITAISQKHGAKFELPAEQGALRPLFILAHNIVFYLWKIVWPARLSSHYPIPNPLDLSHPAVQAGVVGSLLLLALLGASLRRTRALATGWLIFFVLIFPTMGVIGFTIVIASDKYAYLPAIGLLIALTWALDRWSATGKRAPRAAIGLAVLGLGIAAAEACATHRYYAYWRDTQTLYEHMLSLAPDAAAIHNNLGLELARQGQTQAAMEHYLKAIAKPPGSPEAHNNLAVLLVPQGRLLEAIEQCRLAVQGNPRFPEAHHNLGRTLQALGQLDEAAAEYRAALELRPDYGEAHFNLGTILSQQQRTDEALAQFSLALSAEPRHWAAHNEMAALLAQQNRLSEAIEHWRAAAQLKPEWPDPHYNLAMALALTKRPTEAEAEYRQLLRLRPEDADGHANLGNVLATLGRTDEARQEYNQALQIQPSHPLARKGLQDLPGASTATSQPS